MSLSFAFDHYLYLDRGPQSIVERFQLYDASGYLVEDIHNYHVLYRLVQTCTGSKEVMEKSSNFFKECCTIDMHDGMMAWSAEARDIITITIHNVNSAFGGAIYLQTTAGGTL